MAQFMHPNIVRVFGSVDKGVCMYITHAYHMIKYADGYPDISDSCPIRDMCICRYILLTLQDIL